MENTKGLTVDDLRQREFDAKTELRRRLLTGEPTGPTRAKIDEFSRLLQAEVTRHGTEEEVKAETKRSLRDRRRHRMTETIIGDALAEITKRMAPIALPAPIKDVK